MQHGRNGNVKNVHKKVGDPIRDEENDHGRTRHGIEIVIDIFHNQIIGKQSDNGRNEEFSNNQHGRRYVGNGGNASGIAGNEEKGFATGFAKGGTENGRLNVGIFGNEAQTTFHHAKTALTTTQNDARQFVIGIFGRPLGSRNDGTNQLHNGNQQTSVGTSTGMVPYHLPHGMNDGPTANAPFFARKVVPCHGEGNGHVSHGDNEIGRPKETK
mmetsp:Transcript_13888/g.28673  ORF Transcript_13888/g.28673 Transcript_13888/m.28673 type:complete len:213 (-) Transcript_13888:67-705(-)